MTNANQRPATARVPSGWLALLTRHLKGRMKPARWLGNVIREWEKAGRHRVSAAATFVHAAGPLSRIVATVPVALVVRYRRDGARSESEWLWWLAADRLARAEAPRGLAVPSGMRGGAGAPPAPPVVRGRPSEPGLVVRVPARMAERFGSNKGERYRNVLGVLRDHIREADATTSRGVPMGAVCQRRVCRRPWGEHGSMPPHGGRACAGFVSSAARCTCCKTARAGVSG